MESFNNIKLDNIELLEAQAHVWNHIFNFINTYSLKCAVELNIPDIIHKHSKPMTLTQLISSLPIHPSKSQSIHRLMRILVHSGFFATQEEGYVLTNASKLLLKNNPLSVTPFLLAMLDPALIKPWDGLSTWFGNEVPTPYETAHGMMCWQHTGLDPSLNRLFNDAMASDARLVTSVLIEKCRDVFEGLRTLVDVGGGTGTMAKAFAKAFSGLECIVLDLPHVVADLEIQSEGNVKYVGGDMFDAVPPADAIFLKWILHDWNDEECVKILKKCKEAITCNGKIGKVIIVDMVVDDNNEKDNESSETKLFFDMLMMIVVTGKERNKKEWSRLFFEAGFSNFKITPILGLRSLIEIYP